MSRNSSSPAFGGRVARAIGASCVFPARGSGPRETGPSEHQGTRLVSPNVAGGTSRVERRARPWRRHNVMTCDANGSDFEVEITFG